ncbi:DUF6586 family protein [Balneatrix alpica]|uniref:DUF6586 family protein n=1 Tax=Balneatrix alpica TaxID=75684 RepID=A0ABV5ZBS9_9GAMM|nr:DUF6586 family protein [Balneatrix alpica]
MTHPYATRTNQKLYFARLHLEALTQAHSSQGWNKHALIESYHESIVAHLFGAYHALLREIAQSYKLPPEQVRVADDLMALLESRGYEGPEYLYIQQLLADQNSWLSQLVRSYRACWRAQEQREKASSSERLSEIHLVQVNPDHEEDGELQQQLQQWLGQLQQLVERCREQTQEW